MWVSKLPIENIYIYQGHRVFNPKNNQIQFKGPYGMSVEKHNFMFDEVNKLQNKQWKISPVYGEHLSKILSNRSFGNDLLVIPAGESTELDGAFSDDDLSLIKNAVRQGMRLYGTCGSAYWLSKKRIWNDKCSVQPEEMKEIIKTSSMDFFSGIAVGPLSPYPGQTYSTMFFHEAVQIQTLSGRKVTVLLSGGGTFLSENNEELDRSVKTLAFYPSEELEKYQKNKSWEKAVISCEYGLGKVILAMVHPGYGAEDINVEAYSMAFQSRTDRWQEIKDSLSSLEERMNFVGDILKDFEVD